MQTLRLLMLITASAVRCLAHTADDYFANSYKKDGELIRNRRQTESKTSLTQQDRIEFIEAHNNFRRLVTEATDMQKMAWNGGLESMAQQWANQCDFKHGQPTRSQKPFTYIGQNLYATGVSTYNVTKAVQAWYAENQFYNYSSQSCQAGKVCGHYTQVVWSTSYAIGCGIAFCPVLADSQLTNAYYVVCNYGPAGNIVGTRPYEVGGATCSNCTAEKPVCDAGLCSVSDECSVITECTVSNLTWCLCDESYYEGLLIGYITSSEPSVNNTVTSLTMATNGPATTIASNVGIRLTPLMPVVAFQAVTVIVTSIFLHVTFCQ